MYAFIRAYLLQPCQVLTALADDVADQISGDVHLHEGHTPLLHTSCVVSISARGHIRT